MIIGIPKYTVHRTGSIFTCYHRGTNVQVFYAPDGEAAQAALRLLGVLDSIPSYFFESVVGWHIYNVGFE